MRRWLPAALVALLAAAVFVHTLPFEFVYDDVPVIFRNERLHSLAAWRDILTGPWWPRGLYRPLTSLTFAVDWAAGGGKPFLFHLGNVLAHAAATLLVFLLAEKLLPRPSAIAAALLFAVHPVHVEAVANVVGRAEILATVFAVASALCYRAHGERGSAAAAGGTLLFLLLGLAGKESAFAVPGLLLVVDWAAASLAGERALERFRRHWWLWVATALLALAWLLLRARLLGSLAGDYPAPGLGGTSAIERVAVMLPVVPEYLRLLFLPARLSADYSPDYLPVSARLTLRGLAGLIVVGAAVATALLARRRAPAVSAGLAWIGAALIIVGNVVVPSGILLAERTLYLASVGACLVAGWGWGWLYARRARPAVALLVVVVAAGSLRSWTRAEVWRDNTTFFAQIVRDAPGSFRADWVAGMLAYRAGDNAAGERLMRRGFSIYGGHGAMWSDFARQLERERRWSEAAAAFWRAFAADSQLQADAARAVANHVQAGELDSAASRLRIAEAALGETAELRISASHLAAARGDYAEATRLRAAVAREHPEDWRYWLLTAEAAARGHRCPELLLSVERLRALRSSLPRLTALADTAAAIGCAPAGARP